MAKQVFLKDPAYAYDVPLTGTGIGWFELDREIAGTKDIPEGFYIIKNNIGGINKLRKNRFDLTKEILVDN